MSENRNVLIVLVGLPGTGKSTFRKRFENKLDFNIISSDDFIEQRAKDEGKTYSEVFKTFIGAATAAVEEEAEMAVIDKVNVIWDQTNLTVKKRKSILDKFEKYVKVAVYFEIENSWEWMQRLYKRAGEEGKYIPYNILASMHKTYEAPSYAEGFDYITDVRAFDDDVLTYVMRNNA